MNILKIAIATLLDLIPIIGVLLFFQLIALRKGIPNLAQRLSGLFFLFVGLVLFIAGLEIAVFPLGQVMAAQLTAPLMLAEKGYFWIYAFAALIGFATTVAEPTLLAMTMKVEEITGGAVKAFPLRIAVAVGVGIGVTLGAYRIVMGYPLWALIGLGYGFLIVQTFFAPKSIIPLAYDSGGVTTSTVTVPLLTALGLGLANNLPGKTMLMDGFGMIALASLFPMITVLFYAQVGQWLTARRKQLQGGENEVQASNRIGR